MIHLVHCLCLRYKTESKDILLTWKSYGGRILLEPPTGFRAEALKKRCWWELRAEVLSSLHQVKTVTIAVFWLFLHAVTTFWGAEKILLKLVPQWILLKRPLLLSPSELTHVLRADLHAHWHTPWPSGLGPELSQHSDRFTKSAATGPKIDAVFWFSWMRLRTCIDSYTVTVWVVPFITYVRLCSALYVFTLVLAAPC